MRALPAIGLALTVGFIPTAHANDLADALSFVRDSLGDDGIEGYEDYVDAQPDEALALILESDGTSPLPWENAPRSKNPPPFQTLGNERLNYAALSSIIAEASERTGLPAALIDAVIRTESGYRTAAVSRTGAQGLMQLMPGTAADMGVRNPFDPRDNILGGAKYLRRMFDRFGSIRLAVAAYNAGPGNVRKHNGVPPFRETRRYVATVMRRYQQSRLDGLR